MLHLAPTRALPRLLALLALALLPSPAAAQTPGTPALEPGASGGTLGASYIADPHQGGRAPTLGLVAVEWGRLVDVWDRAWVDTNDNGIEEPGVDDFPERLVYAELVVAPDVATTPGRWTLTSSLDGRPRLVVEAANTPAPDDAFDTAVAEATAGLVPVAAKSASPAQLPPWTLVPRNACLVLRFDDLLDAATIGPETVRLDVGVPPTAPFPARVLPDANHGGVDADGVFRTTRVLVDPTVQAWEDSPEPLASNPVGLPASPSSGAPNLALRLPTQLAPAAGVFARLANPSGATLAPGTGPPAETSAAAPLVRAARSGNASDGAAQFLQDDTAPRLVGRQRVGLSDVQLLSAATATYRVDVKFGDPACALLPQAGFDGLAHPSGLTFAVVGGGTLAGGVVDDLEVRLEQPVPLPTTERLAGRAELVMTWRDALAGGGGSLAACFLQFTPEPAAAPAAGVSSSATVKVEFSEPLLEESVRPYDSFALARGADRAQLTAFDRIVALTAAGPDGTSFRIVPALALDNTEAVDEYFVHLTADAPKGLLTDLAGNAVESVPPPIAFTLDEMQPNLGTGGFVLRFDGSHEVSPGGTFAGAGIEALVRGQFTFDAGAEELAPRPVERFSLVADRTRPMVGAMQAIAEGVQTPLSGLGSKLQHLWRHADVGLDVDRQDDAFYDLDLEGLALAPLNGQVVADAFPGFELRLAHGSALPDELVDPVSLLPSFPGSGFRDGEPFVASVLSDPQNPSAVVHPKAAGLQVNPADVFLSLTGTPMLPLAWNQGPGDATTWTWRDRAILARGGKTAQGNALANAGGAFSAPGGVPLNQEVYGLGIATGQGSVYGVVPQPGVPLGVPSIGLPILMEHRCYPSDSSLSLNAFDVSIAVTSSARPFFRAFSTGGIDSSGQAVEKDPDLEPSPSGGFNANPGLGPLGAPTPPRDNAVYLGQLDVVVRTNRIYTIPIGAGSMIAPYPDPNWALALTEPAPQDLPAGTSIVLAFRGHDGPLSTAQQQAAFDARALDVYGDLDTGDPTSPGSGTAPWVSWDEPVWQGDVSALDGLRYLQTRVTLISNAKTLETPTLSSLAVAFYE